MADIFLGDLPSSIDAEQAVLGCVLTNPDVITDISDKLKPEYFHVETHRGLFSVFAQMFINAQPVDIVTVIEKSVQNKVFDSAVNARAYLKKLMDCGMSSRNIGSYAKIVEEMFMMRQLLYAANEITEIIRAGEKTAQEALDFAENKIYEIRSRKEVRGLVHIKPTAIEVMKELSELSENPDSAHGKGLSTSFSKLDEYIFGLNPTDMILVAGRPGMGKTTFAINIAVNVSKRYKGKKVVIFSLEMSKEQIVKKIIGAEAKITSEQMRTGRIDRADWKRIGESVDILSSYDIYIDETANVTIGEMKAKLRRVKDLGLVVIDYLQLMSTGRRDGNRVIEISEITRNIKIMAKELNVPVIVASQLSRSPESRSDKRPVLSDLRESGSIEQDADIVIFLYRDAYYNKETEYVNEAECIISKNRHGETASVKLNFEGNYSRFTSIDYSHEQ